MQPAMQLAQLSPSYAGLGRVQYAPQPRGLGALGISTTATQSLQPGSYYVSVAKDDITNIFNAPDKTPAVAHDALAWLQSAISGGINDSTVNGNPAASSVTAGPVDDTGATYFVIPITVAAPVTIGIQIGSTPIPYNVSTSKLVLTAKNYALPIAAGVVVVAGGTAWWLYSRKKKKWR
jgi:hypothetical protein